jgi:hypothetical protein
VAAPVPPGPDCPGSGPPSSGPCTPAKGTRKNARCLGCYRQALFVLAWYRDKTDIPRLGAGFGLSQATSYRYVAEGTAVTAAEAPGLEEALERAVAEGPRT